VRNKEIFRSGFISIVGRPNVGKSTLLNCILGEKVSIISEKPQTTRNKVLGIKNIPNTQIIFLDTPGIHRAESRLNKYMVKVALSTYHEVDVIIFLVGTDGPIQEDNRFIIKTLKKANTPIILVINKIDLVKKESLLPLIDSYRSLFDFHKIIPCSSLFDDGVEIILEEIVKILPEGPKYFPENMITDQPERFIVAEIIREKIMKITSQEIPYSVAVLVDSFKEKREENIIVIHATIHVERDSQKGIIIGRKGSLLKEIGKKAREELEGILGARIYLGLFVKVRKNWGRDNAALKSFGYQI
jgi:GTP-binding protein Era